MIKVGITGGIGSGKTTICSIFSTLDIPIYNADDEAKKLMHNDIELKNALIANFGEKTYENGHLNRPYLAKLVFNDQSNLEIINGLVHPKVFQHLVQWFDQQTSRYALYESALLQKGHSKNMVDKVIYVYTSLEERIKRVMKRDQSERTSILRRMRNQPDPVSGALHADYVIVNESRSLLDQVLCIHRELSRF